MPPDIIDIIIRATGQLGAWLYDSVDILLRATPGFGLSPMMIVSGFIVLVMGWEMIHEKGG